MASITFPLIGDMGALLRRAETRVHRDPRVIINELRAAREGEWHELREDELWKAINDPLNSNNWKLLYHALDELAAILARHHRRASDLAIEARNAVQYLLREAAHL